MGFLTDMLQKVSGGNPESAADLPQEDKDLAHEIKAKVLDIRQASSRITHEGIWMTNIAYLLGFDSIFYDTQTRQFQSVARGSTYLRRNRVHVNKILPTVNNRLARLCKNPPRYDVRPKSSSDDDKEASRLGLDVLNNVFDTQEVSRKRLELMMWVQECGHSYMKPVWDPMLGEYMVNPETGEAGFQGDIRLDIASAFEVFVDQKALNMEDARWAIHAKVRDLQYFRDQYPEKGSLVTQEDAWLLSVQYEGRIQALNNQGMGQTNAANQMKNSAIELVYYERRTVSRPMGRMVVVASGVILKDDELAVGEIPLVKFDDIIIGGKFYPESLITHLRPLQDQYNRVIAKRAEWTNRLLAGKYRAPKGSALTQESMTDQSGEVLYYTPVPNAAPPEAMQVPNIPQYAYQEEESHEKNMNDISGINDPSRGQMPSATIPAIGMQLLVEQDDTRIGVITESHELAWAKVGRLVLKYAEKFYEMPRLLKIAGPDSEYKVKEFKGQDISGNTDVIVIRGSTLPGSKVLKRQEIMNLYGQGLLGDPNDPTVRQKVLEMLEFGDVGEAWKDQALNANQSQKFITLIEEGGIPEYNEFDDHGYIAQEMNRYRKTEKFDKLDRNAQLVFHDFLNKQVNGVANLIAPGSEQDFQHAEQNYNKVMSEESSEMNSGMHPGAPDGAAPAMPMPPPEGPPQ